MLFRIDPLQFQIALDNAKANLGNTRLTIIAMRDDYQRMLRDIAAQQSQVRARSGDVRSLRTRC